LVPHIVLKTLCQLTCSIKKINKARIWGRDAQ
jgi:hypothetical protein